MIRQFYYFAVTVFTENDINGVPKEPLTSGAVKLSFQIVFGIAAAAAMLMIVISALRMTISRGNAQDVQKARDAIVYASIGLAISLSGFTIVTFVLENL